MFLTLTVGACIALISQIYNMPGNLTSFLLIWAILALPIIYFMNAASVGVLYLLGIMWYFSATQDASLPIRKTWIYWLLLGAFIPFYKYLLGSKPNSGFIPIFNYLIPAAILYGFFMFTGNGSVILIGYFCLLGSFYMIGHLDRFKNMGLVRNGFWVIGAIGSIGILLVFSFYEAWEGLKNNIHIELWEGVSTAVAFLGAITLLGHHVKNKNINISNPIMPLFLIFIPIYFLGLSYPRIAQILVNILIMIIAILTIKKGVDYDHLGILNYGLIIISVLMMCRFFDSNISFVIRGLMFVAVGLSFFLTNYLLIKKRKTHGQ